jgi:hypothetical protein
MKYRYTLGMDNEKGESCNVTVWFDAESPNEIEGITAILSDGVLHPDDLSYLEEWIVMGAGKWKTLQ